MDKHEAITIASVSDIKALHLYVFDSKRRELSEGLQMLRAAFSHLNPDFPDNFVDKLCGPNVNTEVKTLEGKDEAARAIADFKNTSGISDLRALVQVAQFATPDDLHRETDVWVVTFAHNPYSPAGTWGADVLFLSGSIGLLNPSESIDQKVLLGGVDLAKINDLAEQLSFLIKRPEIKEKDIKRIVAAVADCISEFESSRNLVPITFGIGGYDSDPRELFEVPEVRSWCKQLYQEVPFIFSFLDSQTIHWFFPCLAEIVVDRTPQGTLQVHYDPKTKEFIDEIFSSSRNLLQNLASSQIEFDRLALEIEARILKGIDAGFF